MRKSCIVMLGNIINTCIMNCQAVNTKFSIMHNKLTFILFLVIIFGHTNTSVLSQPADSSLLVRKTKDFTIDGSGTAAHWETTQWFNITLQNGPHQKQPGNAYASRVKLLYSDKGMYFLFDCEDKKLTSTIMEDFGALFKEDVVEVFLWPDTTVPIYLEYEISPLNYELVILVPNIKGRLQGWKPWNYTEDVRVKHATSVHGGQKKSMAAVAGWKAEFFIPFRLMNPIVRQTPRSGTKWKGNFYRIDYDQEASYYSWKKTNGSFHEFQKFGTLIFE
jgi:hypothetical protein